MIICTQFDKITNIKKYIDSKKSHTRFKLALDLVNKAKKNYGLNLKLLLTWGASVGGFVLPLDNFIKTGRFDLNEAQQTALVKLQTTSFEASDAIMSRCVSTAISLIWTEEQVHAKGAQFLKVLKEALS